MDFVGKINIENTLIITDPSYSIHEWCQQTYNNVFTGTYNCYQTMVKGKITQIIALKDDVSFESLDFVEADDVIGMDKEVIGIFDLDYLKQNKETHEKEWRETLKTAITVETPNPKYKEYLDSSMHKAFFKKMEKRKQTLMAKYSYAPEYLKVIEDISNYDPEAKMDSSSLLHLNYSLTNYVTAFFEGKESAKARYFKDDCSKKSFVTHKAVCVDEHCFVTHPDFENNAYTCTLGYAGDSNFIACVIIDFADNEQDDVSEEDKWEYTEFDSIGSEDNLNTKVQPDIAADMAEAFNHKASIDEINIEDDTFEDEDIEIPDDAFGMEDVQKLLDESENGNNNTKTDDNDDDILLTLV